MKLLSAEQMKDVDRRASEDYLIPSLILMENAGLRVLDTIKVLIADPGSANIIILAGKGNNGGDGLVVGRHLINAGARVDTFVMGEPQSLSPDAYTNYLILAKMTDKIFPLRTDEDLEHLKMALLSADLIVDAIYGTGFRGSLNDFETRVAQTVNLSQALVVAVDIPSGVEANTGKIHGVAIKANHTVTLALPKLGLILAPGKDYVGKLAVADISIPQALLEDNKFKMNLITESMVHSLLKPRLPESHKGTYGHALVVGGSTGMTGAVIMTSYAALRTGAGLVTAAVPESLVPIIENSVMEVMSRPLAETSEACISPEAMPALENLLGTVSVCAIGPGMSRYQEANTIMRSVLAKSGVPILIDADGLNALEGDTAMLKDRQVPIVITPHPGEMVRLTGLAMEEIQQNRLEIARHYAIDWGITVVLKGNQTVVASPSGEIFINTTGNPGMATAGSGDVLSGIILGLMSQGMRPHSAALAGVYIHGRTGDQAASIGGERGLIAGDLLNYLPQTLQQLETGAINK